MKYIIVIFAFLLAGCASKPVPVKQKFPEAPQQLMEPCQDLKKLEKDTKLSDVAKTITENYTLYHECTIKSKAWVEWYKANKNIFEGAK
jgi:PBP1b-binding outer membrane lipoprotein LpoB